MDDRSIMCMSIVSNNDTMTSRQQNGQLQAPEEVGIREYAYASRHSHDISGHVSDREALFAEFAPLVRRLIIRYGNTAELRRDLPGELYCSFCNLLNAFDTERGVPLRSYLVRQLTAAAYAYARKHWRIKSREVNLDEADTGFGSEEDPTGRWLHSISQQQVAARLPEAMQRRPRRQRQVVIWRYYEERSFEEIAERLGVKNATVRSLLRHGLANLRQQMVVRDCEPSETAPPDVES